MARRERFVRRDDVPHPRDVAGHLAGREVVEDRVHDLGPQIRQLIKDKEFKNSMNTLECAAWTSFVQVVNNFLGNTKAANHAILVSSMIEAFQELGCLMSIKMHFLFSHMEKFPENLGAMSDEQGERFHQDMRQMEERYQGRWDAVMMADYCWSLKRDNPAAAHTRESKKRRFTP